MTDDEVYALYGVQYDSINNHINTLVANAMALDPSMAKRILANWQEARIDKMAAMDKNFANQNADVDALIEHFSTTVNNMSVALNDLQNPANTITKIAGLINFSVGVGNSLNANGRDKQQV